ncbi:MAG: TlpA family protein disulfide reductase [Treponema sp.]
MKKSFIAILLVFSSFGLFFSCSKENDKSSELTVTENEEKDNWMSYTEIGFKVQMPQEISSKKDNISVHAIGDEDDETFPIYKGYLYRYISDATNKGYDDIVADESLTDEQKREKIKEEIVPKIKDIFALVTLRTPLITEENPVEKILNTDDITVLRKTDEYTQVVAFDEGVDLAMLSDDEKAQYQGLIAISKKITEGAKVANPMPRKASLQTLTGLKFKTTDLNGKEVTQEIFKKADITMVNIWATWCPPCKAELPDIGKLEKKYREKGCAVVAICSDVTDEDDSALEEAKEIIKDSECDFVVLKKNASLDAIYNNIQAYPTTLFFNKNGDIIGSVIVGGRSEEAFAKAFDSLLAKIKK